MFCSNCGKSLKSEDENCPHCGQPVGDSRFEGYPYTGAQPKLRPGQAIRVPQSFNHYSAEFTVDNGSSAPLPSDSDSIYRAASGAGITGYGDEDKREPLYNAEQESRQQPEEETEETENQLFKRFHFKHARKPEVEEEPEETGEPEEVGEDGLTESERNSIKATEPTVITRGAGISADVRAYMDKLRENYERQNAPAEKPAKKADTVPGGVAPLDDLYGEEEEEEAPKKSKKSSKKKTGDKLAFLKKKKKKSKKEESFDDIDESVEEPADEPDEPDEEEITYGDEEFKREVSRKNLSYIIYAALLVIVIVLGVIFVPKILTGKTRTAPVENVTLSLWNDGIELLENHMGEKYRRDRMALYDQNNPTSYLILSEKTTADLDSMDSLMPESPMLYDGKFINAIKAIQESINNCLSNDALALTDGTKTAAEKNEASALRWESVRNQIDTLKQCVNPGQLDAIAKGERVEVILKATATPEPTATPALYQTLSNGSSGVDVEKLQQRLKELNYLTGTVDGKFGPKTKTAVQKFQESVGLEATGIADEQTQIALYGAAGAN